MTQNLNWERDGNDWPNRECSRFIEAGGIHWHVQQIGDGPVALLLHGTGASTHSWRDLMPLLSRRFSVIAPDLPGHAFTSRPRPSELSLSNMAHAVCALLRHLNVRPDIVVGHSAGAAVALRLALDKCVAPAAIISLNGALFPFSGLARHIFPPVARLMLLNPLTPHIFSARAANPARVRQLIENTGSHIDARGLALYGRLFRNSGHVLGALGMMANWDLGPLQRAMHQIDAPVVLVAADADGAVPASNSLRARDALPHGRVIYLRGLGHLAHEEAPEKIAGLIAEAAREHGLQPAA